MKRSCIPVLILFLGLILAGQNSSSQVVNKFGIKGGLILSKLSMNEFVSDAFSYEPERKYKFLSFDIGLYAELFDSRFFCVSTELHYNVKGEESFEDFMILQPNRQNDGFEFKKVNDRFHYISLQVLPRWRFMVNTEDKLYVFGGPRFDLRIGSSKSGGTSDIPLSNGIIESGFTVGFGNEFWELLITEFRYEINLSNVYNITYGNTVVKRKNHSFSLLMGLSLKKLLKIHF